MRQIYSYAYLSLVLTCIFPYSGYAAQNEVDPKQTYMVLSALMSESNSIIPTNSSCVGNYGQKGKAAVKDMLSVQLAYLYSGVNKITGNCINDQCQLSIEHNAGEDVYFADIRFKLRNGKARISTLHCILTP